MKKWKFVFGFAAFLVAVDMLKFPFRRDLEFFDFIWLIFGGFSLFPLYGYAYGVAIGNKLIAIVIFSVNALLFIGGLVVAGFLMLNQPSGIALAAMTFAFAAYAIYLYPQFMYAFKSNELWQKNA